MNPGHSRGLSTAQRNALHRLHAAKARWPWDNDPWVGVVTTSASALIDGQAWIHWRTARALAARGLVVIEAGDEPRLRLA